MLRIHLEDTIAILDLGRLSIRLLLSVGFCVRRGVCDYIVCNVLLDISVKPILCHNFFLKAYHFKMENEFRKIENVFLCYKILIKTFNA